MQGFNKNVPTYQGDLLSGPVRTNMRALASHHSGVSAPTSPDEGWTWFDTSNPLNLKLWIYWSGGWRLMLSNIQAGPPSQTQLNKYTHLQGVAGLTWSVTHNLGTRNVMVSVWDSSNKMIIPSDIELNSTNTAIITFGVAVAGWAVFVA